MTSHWPGDELPKKVHASPSWQLSWHVVSRNATHPLGVYRVTIAALWTALGVHIVCETMMMTTLGTHPP